MGNLYLVLLTEKHIQLGVRSWRRNKMIREWNGFFILPDDVILKCSLIKAFGGGSRWALGTCGSLGPISFIFMQFQQQFCQIIGFARPPLGWRTPPPTGKSWIRYWQVWGKVIFSQVCVIPSVQWGAGLASFPACITGHMTRGGLHPGGSASGEGLGRPPRALQNTVNKRTVRILLECILLVFKFVLVCYEATDMS